MLNGGTAFQRGNHLQSRKLKQVSGIIVLMSHSKTSKSHEALETIQFTKMLFSMFLMILFFPLMILILKRALIHFTEKSAKNMERSFSRSRSRSRRGRAYLDHPQIINIQNYRFVCLIYVTHFLGFISFIMF